MMLVLQTGYFLIKRQMELLHNKLRQRKCFKVYLPGN